MNDKQPQPLGYDRELRDQLLAEVPLPQPGYWARIDDLITAVDNEPSTERIDGAPSDSSTSDSAPSKGAVSNSALIGSTSVDTAGRYSLFRALIPLTAAAAVLLICVWAVGARSSGTSSLEFRTTGDETGEELQRAIPDERTARPEITADRVPPRLVDHWNALYAVWDCTQNDGEGGWLEPFQSTRDDVGIHSHGDGVISIHPFFPEAAGVNATLGWFELQMGIRITDDSIRLDDGRLLPEAISCNAGAPVVHLRRWADDAELRANPDTAPTIVTKNLSAERFYNDFEVWVIAFAPVDAVLPLPPEERFEALGKWRPANLPTMATEDDGQG